MTNEEKIICKMYLDDLDKTHGCNEYKLLIQLLEQQPCEDCVSRQAVLEEAMDYGGNTFLIPVNSVKRLSSVKPIYKKCHNANTDYADCDQFVCSNCGIELQDWCRVERDEEDGDVTYHKYEFNFCPNCGAKREVEI